MRLQYENCLGYIRTRGYITTMIAKIWYIVSSGFMTKGMKSLPKISLVAVVLT